MAITLVTRVWSGETWDDDIEGAKGYTDFFRVFSNDPDESRINVRAALPLPGTPHSEDNSAFCRGRSAVRSAESRLIWECTVEYEFDPKEPEEPTESPLDEPTKFRWTAGLYTKPVIKDRNGDAIVNSAGDFFDPPPEREVPRVSVNIQKNVASVPVAVLTYPGRVNDSSFTVDGVSVVAEAAKITAIDVGELQEKDDIPYRVFTCTIEFEEDTWDLELLDQGYRIKDGTDLKDILIEDEDGEFNRPSSPVLLDGSGGKLTDPSPTTAVFKTFHVQKLLDFSVLPGVS